mgnify:CR=1 FL=1
MGKKVGRRFEKGVEDGQDTRFEEFLEHDDEEFGGRMHVN